MKKSLMLLTAVVFLAACVAVEVPDPFAGKYAATDSNDRLFLNVIKSDSDVWRIGVSEKDFDSIKPWPGNDRFVASENPVDLNKAFTVDTKLNGITCLVSQDTSRLPAICKVPIGVEFQIHYSITRTHDKKLSSKTGYILLIGSAAGVFVFDIKRL